MISQEIIKLEPLKFVLLTTRYRSSLHIGDLDLLARSPEVIDLFMVFTHFLEKYFTQDLLIWYTGTCTRIQRP
jgi:hypothetical protein